MKMKMRRRKTSHTRRKMARRRNITRKNGKAYIVSDWLTDIGLSSGSSGDESDNQKEKVAPLL